MLTEMEKSAFCQTITKGWALGYFYTHDNVPLHFIYKDRVIEGELTDLEKRNKEITEGVWMDAYNYYSVGNIYYTYICRPSLPQMIKSLQHPLQTFMYSKARPISEESCEGRAYVSADQFRTNLEAWMHEEGWRIVEERRKEPPANYVEWQILLAAPDRTQRIVSLMPVGNQVISEMIVTWTEEGKLRETAVAIILLYDDDGTVLVDRDYLDHINWPGFNESFREELRSRELAGSSNEKTRGELDTFLNRYKSKKIEGTLTNLEKQNKETVETRWVDAHNNLDYRLFHPGRYRVQLPLQKVSYNLEVSKEIEARIRTAVPDRKIRAVLTYAKGNQVVAESIMSWTEGGIYKESPCLSFLLFDKDGLIIRERSYINLANWPGASELSKTVGLA